VEQYESFRTKDGEDIETMLSRFQVMIFGMKVLDKICSIEIILIRFLEVSSQVQTQGYKLGLESLIINLVSYEMELNHDEPKPKSKSITLRSKGKIVKALRIEEEDPKKVDEDVEIFDGDELPFLTRRVKQQWKYRGISPRKGDFPYRGSSFREKNEEQRTDLTTRGHATSKLIVLIFRMITPRRKA